MSYLPTLRISYNTGYGVYEVYNTHDGSGWFSGTYMECENFINNLIGEF